MKNANGEKQMQRVWHIPLCRGAERIMINGEKAHSTQKPEAILYRVILSSSKIGDVVLDPFFGSGTTGAVAKKLKRSYIGLERNSAYVTVARNRIAAIPEPLFADEMLNTPSKKSLPRVKFGLLIENGYLEVGQPLYSKDRKHTAIIKADAQITCDDFTGSIHKTAACVQGLNAFNGWEYWHYEDQNREFQLLDTLRHQYRQDNGLV